ncbi:MAG: hypothetical protein ABEJ91_02610 [Candidatus Nanohaloarchaea archaeon]
MLPELILLEEERENLPLLVLLGALSGFIGYGAAKLLFPTQADLLGVAFASIPLIYPLVDELMVDEREERDYLPEILSYSSLFTGEVIAFTVLGLAMGGFGLQRQVIGLSGNAVLGGSFGAVLVNNLMVYLGIFGLAAIIGSAGALVLTWNASVLGVFLADLVSGIPDKTAAFACSTPKLAELGVENASPLCYLPHASFEMGGFLLAGLTGSMVSAAIYRRDLDEGIWENFSWLLLTGVSAIVTGAALETGKLVVFAASLLLTGLFAYKVYLERGEF